MTVKIPLNFSGQIFAGKYDLALDDFYAYRGNLYCPSLPDLTDDDLLDCLVTPTHSITPQQSLIAVGGTVKIIVTGAPDTTEAITIDGIEHDVMLDNNGRVEIVQTCESAGEMYIRDAHGNIVKVEVADV